MKAHDHHRSAFTLVELLVCLGIISLLIGLLMPAIQRIRASAAAVQCQSNLRQIGVAIHHFHANHQRFPGPSQYAKRNPDYVTNFWKYAEDRLAWPAQLLPYIEQNALWSQTQQAFELNVETWIDPPHVGNATVIPLFVCPLDRRLLNPVFTPSGQKIAVMSYVGNAGSLYNGIFLDFNEIRFSDVIDGHSTTIMAGERPPPDDYRSGKWYTIYQPLPVVRNNENTVHCPPRYDVGIEVPRDPCEQFPTPCLGPGRIDRPCDRGHYWSMHPGGAHFLMVDGSVHFFKYSVSDRIMRALCTRNGGETVQLPED